MVDLPMPLPAVFQLTRPRGTRLFWPSDRDSWSCFNSRVRVGRDKSAKALVISPLSFNSRVRVGRDGPLYD